MIILPIRKIINSFFAFFAFSPFFWRILITCPGGITSPSQSIVYYNFRKKAITFTCDFSYVIITKVQFYAVFVFISVHVTCFILKGFILDPNLFLPIINTHNKKKHPMRNSAGCFFPYIKYSLPLKRPQVEEPPYD